MNSKLNSQTGSILLWVALVIVISVPLVFAASSPLLAWRQPIYIIAGFAGIIAMALLLVQPLLIGGYLAGFRGIKGRQAHRWIGSLLIAAIVIHVVGLWIFSPPDVIDALLFRSPTPFSFWGVIAMWAVFITGGLALFRRKLGLKPKNWQFTHLILVTIGVIGSVVHALLIEGTMELYTKLSLCIAVILVVGKIIIDFRTRIRG